jgi:hypothetical protein
MSAADIYYLHVDSISIMVLQQVAKTSWPIEQPWIHMKTVQRSQILRSAGLSVVSIIGTWRPRPCKCQLRVSRSCAASQSVRLDKESSPPRVANKTLNERGMQCDWTRWVVNTRNAWLHIFQANVGFVTCHMGRDWVVEPSLIPKRAIALSPGIPLGVLGERVPAAKRNLGPVIKTHKTADKILLPLSGYWTRLALPRLG